MEAYKPYIDFIMAGKVAETAYVLTSEGTLCCTNLPIKSLPKYQMDIEDEMSSKQKVAVDEGATLLQALSNKGVTTSNYGIRLHNQRYYPLSYDEDTKTLYLKKDKRGACIVETRTLIVIGTYDEGLNMDNRLPQCAGELNKRVKTLASTLVLQGY